MKKLLAAVLAAMFLFSTAALAETTANPQDRFLLICFEDAGTQTYALLGAGDGTQAFNAFAPESGTYETRFAGFWAAVSQLEPALTLNGKATSLAFLLGGNGNGLLVSLGGTIIAELNGTQAFLIASDSIAPEAISRAAGCDLRVWTPDGVSGAETDAASNLCPRCGQVDDGSAKHRTPISEYCELGHTKCMGNPLHHCASCGKDYPCSKSNSHTTCAKCGEPWCYKAHGDHKTLACGHRGCQVYGHEAEHALCPVCGTYLCSGTGHRLAACGKHHLGAPGYHVRALCPYSNHYYCDGQYHFPAACGIRGHFGCDGRLHTPAPCGVTGHYSCDGKFHFACKP